MKLYGGKELVGQASSSNPVSAREKKCWSRWKKEASIAVLPFLLPFGSIGCANQRINSPEDVLGSIDRSVLSSCGIDIKITEGSTTTWDYRLPEIAACKYSTPMMREDIVRSLEQAALSSDQYTKRYAINALGAIATYPLREPQIIDRISRFFEKAYAEDPGDLDNANNLGKIASHTNSPPYVLERILHTIQKVSDKAWECGLRDILESLAINKNAHHDVRVAAIREIAKCHSSNECDRDSIARSVYTISSKVEEWGLKEECFRALSAFSKATNPSQKILVDFELAGAIEASISFKTYSVLEENRIFSYLSYVYHSDVDWLIRAASLKALGTLLMNEKTSIPMKIRIISLFEDATSDKDDTVKMSAELEYSYFIKSGFSSLPTVDPFLAVLGRMLGRYSDFYGGFDLALKELSSRLLDGATPWHLKEKIVAMLPREELFKIATNDRADNKLRGIIIDQLFLDLGKELAVPYHYVSYPYRISGAFHLANFTQDPHCTVEMKERIFRRFEKLANEPNTAGTRHFVVAALAFMAIASDDVQFNERILAKIVRKKGPANAFLYDLSSNKLGIFIAKADPQWLYEMLEDAATWRRAVGICVAEGELVANFYSNRGNPYEQVFRLLDRSSSCEVKKL